MAWQPAHNHTFAWPAAAEPFTSWACALKVTADSPVKSATESMGSERIKEVFFMEIINMQNDYE
jgi:hypothetical protein